MRCTFSLFCAFLALLVLSLAAPDAIDTDSLVSSSVQGIPQGPSIVGTSPAPASSQVSSEDTPSENDLLAELHGLTSTNTTLSTASSDDNDVTIASSKWSNLKDWYRVDVRFGHQTVGGTHSGTFQLERMYERVYSTLKKCKKGSTLDDCSIRNTVFKDGDNGYRTDSSIILEIEHEYFNPDVPNLQDLGYRMMARLYQKMTAVPENCFLVSNDRKGPFKDHEGGDRDLYFCTIPARALIAYPINGGPVQMVFKVKLEWDHKTDNNKYNCRPFTDDGVAEYGSVPFRNGFNEEIAKMHGWRADRVATWVDCSIKECLETNAKRDGKEWQEEYKNTCFPRWEPRGCGTWDEGPKPENHCPPEYQGSFD